jgi:hypothetical protein
MGSVFVAIAPLTDPQILAAKTATVAGGLFSTLCVSFFVLCDWKLGEREKHWLIRARSLLQSLWVQYRADDRVPEVQP